jgi:PD-(D/E)XK nuclease superfamily
MNLPPWSYGFLSDIANCPHKAFRKHVAKDLPKEAKSPEQLHGIAVHKQAENFISSGGQTPIDEHMKPFAQWFVSHDAQAELKLGMTEGRMGCNYWESPWGRSAIDVLVYQPPNAYIWDWKTGKEREDPRELAVQALLLQANYPQVKTIIGQYIWLKDRKLGQRHNLSATDRTYHGTKATMDQAAAHLASGQWPKIPNPLCGFCPVKSCEHNRG